MVSDIFYGQVLITQKQFEWFEELIKEHQKVEMLIKHLNELEKNENNGICSTLFGALIGTCKVKDMLK